ncbi:MAG: ptsI [Planctomycetaceae bacterium]|nr:ptsI [Planctomycetaceae bacterium]
MRVHRGIAAAKGVAFGSAFVLGTEDFRIPTRFVVEEVVDAELVRFRQAYDAITEEIAANEILASQQLGKEYGAIFGAHLQLLRDPKLKNEIEGLIHRLYSPEHATSKILRHYAQKFENLGDKYLAERADDIYDLEKRILRNLLGANREELSQLTMPVILLASNLTPSETAHLDRSKILGFATEDGGSTSHTAILAAALGIPAVVGLGQFLSEVSGGENIIIDGNAGEVIIDPDEETLVRYRDSAEKLRTIATHLETLRDLPSETTDGVAVRLMGNIEFPEEVEHCIQHGALGVGLYRTEFLYLGQDKIPSEEDHYQAYRRVLEPYQNEPVVIRTLDLGADKLPRSIQPYAGEMANPFLGLRSLRLCLQNRPLFKIQLRALLRAAVYGDLWIMFPLVTTLHELRQAKYLLNEVMDELYEQGIPFKKNIPIGMMVEVPSAAVLAVEFAKEVDFFSIGTNDLIQYTLAVDRSNQTVADLYSPVDPAVLRLIQMVIQAGRQHNVSVTVCGQMSSSPIYTALLVGMGMRRLSVNPSSVPEIKEVIRHISVPQAEEIAQYALANFDVARDIETYLRGELKRICPDLML